MHHHLSPAHTVPLTTTMVGLNKHQETVTLHPRPGFVVKTKIVHGSGGHTYGKKVFINICHDEQVPKPPGEFDMETVFGKIVKSEWEIPIVVSLERQQADKKGVPSFVYDCCINSECFLWVQISKDLRLILIEWALESVETMHDIVLDREYTQPKMLSKGELGETEITQEDLNHGLLKKLEELQNNETAALVEQLASDFSDQEELPDIMNISGRKPLIEEIEELSIKEKMTVLEQQEQLNKQAGPVSSQAILETISETNMGVSEPLEGSETDELMSAEKTNFLRTPLRSADRMDRNVLVLEVSEASAQQKSRNTSAEVLDYSFTLSLEQKEDQFCLIFSSAELTPVIETTLSEIGHNLRIKNLDSRRRLGATNVLDIPFPHNVKPYKTFLVKNEQKLYVFGKITK